MGVAMNDAPALTTDRESMSTDGTLLERRRAWRTRERQRLRRLMEAAELAALLVREGNCAIPGTGWDDAEIRHAKASNDVAANQAAQAVLRLCIGCPVVEVCRRWAEVDRYTGLAAGSSWAWGVTPSQMSIIDSSSAQGHRCV